MYAYANLWNLFFWPQDTLSERLLAGRPLASTFVILQQPTSQFPSVYSVVRSRGPGQAQAQATLYTHWGRADSSQELVDCSLVVLTIAAAAAARSAASSNRHHQTLIVADIVQLEPRGNRTVVLRT